MKKCIICKKMKSLEEFSPRKDSKDGKYGRCRKCHAKTVRESYRKNPEVKLECCRRIRKELGELCDRIKAEKGCVICQDHEAICLDFHHLDPSKKDLSVAALIVFKNRQRLLDEIAKCVVICVKCHRKLHAGMVSLTTDVMVA